MLMQYSIFAGIITTLYILNYIYSAKAMRLSNIGYVFLSICFVLITSNRTLIGDAPVYQVAWEAADMQEFRSPFLVILSIFFGFLDFIQLNIVINFTLIMLMVKLCRSIGRAGQENMVMAYFVGSFSFLITIFELLKESLSIIFVLLAALDLLSHKRNRALIWSLLAAICHPYSVIMTSLFYVASLLPQAYRLHLLGLWMITVYFLKNLIITLLAGSDYSDLFRFYVEGSGNVYIFQSLQFLILIGSIYWIYSATKKDTAIHDYSFLCLLTNTTLFIFSYDYPDIARRFIYRMEIFTIPAILAYLLSIKNGYLRPLCILGLISFFGILLMNPNLALLVQF